MDIKSELSKKGFVFIPKWEPDAEIEYLAKKFGKIVKVSDYVGHEIIPNTQKIRPKTQSNSSKNQYSGKFGLDAFPFHTDLAHWSKPPKFLMLRCVRGFEQVSTKVLPLKYILDQLFELGLRRAVAQPRSNGSNTKSCLLPLLFKINNQRCIRWDSLFLEAVNDNVKRIQHVMLKNETWDMAIDIKLVDSGDTLILNNHSNFHARSNIPKECIDRELERVYFN
ncbi:MULTISPECIES: TauD/TfdA family dioxygenase [Colwellia]|uniref:TauD/TfdA-like domain-containing protein n=1 Tax=Colwellia marinimaniae TaxID=1513592 RepID=A0ABQ0MW18_9GAMM|nr:MULTISPECIES: TauD/TfdA family dioxygenase [Colwellia]GAW96558.1 hypothetical protein MTCD1_02177 [Colwellia marinimaniae]